MPLDIIEIKERRGIFIFTSNFAPYIFLMIQRCKTLYVNKNIINFMIFKYFVLKIKIKHFSNFYREKTILIKNKKRKKWEKILF